MGQESNKRVIFFLITVYTGKYLPKFYFHPFRPHCQMKNLGLGVIQRLKLSLFQRNFFWLN